MLSLLNLISRILSFLIEKGSIEEERQHEVISDLRHSRQRVVEPDPVSKIKMSSLLVYLLVDLFNKVGLDELFRFTNNLIEDVLLVYLNDLVSQSREEESIHGDL